VTDTSQRPVSDNTQHPQETDIHTPGGIRTCNPGKRPAADLPLRPFGHRDKQLNLSIGSLFYYFNL